VLILHRAFLAWRAWRKMGSLCEVLSLGAWRLWGWGKLLCVPHVQKKCKIVSSIIKLWHEKTSRCATNRLINWTRVVRRAQLTLILVNCCC
jgi:hypothetical protein